MLETLLLNVDKELEIFTKIRDYDHINKKWDTFYSKSQHKGILKLDKRGFYLQCETYRVPVYVDLSLEKEFGIETKYVFSRQ